MQKSILLATFVKKDNLYNAIDRISEICNIQKESIFVFLNEDNPKEYILTFNISSENANIKFNSIWENTIPIHRKKQTNTLYSINAMNEVIKNKNNGLLNNSYKLNWGDYVNKFLLISAGKIKEVNIRLVKINQ